MDELEVPVGAIGPPAMNYGQHWRWEGYRRCQYRLMITVGEFFGRVNQSFDQFRRDVSEDMAEHGGDWPEPAFRRFRELAFPPLPALLHDHPDLLADLLLWADLDLLNWLEDGGPPAAFSLRYSANSVDRCSVSSEAIVVEGIAYEIGTVQL